MQAPGAVKVNTGVGEGGGRGCGIWSFGYRSLTGSQRHKSIFQI